MGRGGPFPWQRLRFTKHLFQLRRHKTVILFFPHHLHATRPPLPRVPDFQQYTSPVLMPLMIPKAHHFNVLLREKFLPLLVAFDSFRQTMLKAVQFHRQPRQRAIAIQKIAAHRGCHRNLKPAKRPAFTACQSCFSSVVWCGEVAGHGRWGSCESRRLSPPLSPSEGGEGVNVCASSRRLLPGRMR